MGQTGRFVETNDINVMRDSYKLKFFWKLLSDLSGGD